jgi:hypothetical protein
MVGQNLGRRSRLAGGRDDVVFYGYCLAFQWALAMYQH